MCRSASDNELLDSSTDYTEQLIRRVNAELDMYVEYMKDISDLSLITARSRPICAQPTSTG